MVTRWWPKNTNPFCQIFRSLKWKRRDLYCARNKPKRNLSGLTLGRFGCLCPEWCWSAWRSTRPQRNYSCCILEVFEPVLASVLVVPTKTCFPPKKIHFPKWSSVHFLWWWSCPSCGVGSRSCAGDVIAMIAHYLDFQSYLYFLVCTVMSLQLSEQFPYFLYSIRCIVCFKWCHHNGIKIFHQLCVFSLPYVGWCHRSNLYFVCICCVVWAFDDLIHNLYFLFYLGDEVMSILKYRGHVNMLSLQNIYVFLIQSFLKSSIRTDIGIWSWRMKTASVTEAQPQVMKLGNNQLWRYCGTKWAFAHTAESWGLDMIESRRKAIGWASSRSDGRSVSSINWGPWGEPWGNLGNLKGILLSSDGVERRDVWRWSVNFHPEIKKRGY